MFVAISSCQDAVCLNKNSLFSEFVKGLVSDILAMYLCNNFQLKYQRGLN
jgi:hypothetical protein